MSKTEFREFRVWINQYFPEWKSKAMAKDLPLLYSIWKKYKDLLP